MRSFRVRLGWGVEESECGGNWSIFFYPSQKSSVSKYPQAVRMSLFAKTASATVPPPLRLSGAIARGLLTLPFNDVAPDVASDDPELNTLIERLRKARAMLVASSALSNKAALGTLDFMIAHVTLFLRQHVAQEGYVGAMEDAPIIPTGDLSDYLLLDVLPESYESIGIELGVQRWASAVGVPVKFPVMGTLWGANKRVMVPLQCRAGKLPPVIVHMLLDTGAPSTLLCAATLAHLGFNHLLPHSAKVELHGCPIAVGVSHSHFVDNDVLGADWLVAARACVSIDYFGLSAAVAVAPGPGTSL